MAKEKIDEILDQSDNVNEIMRKSPNWMIKWGSLIFFLILSFLILGSTIIKYNDIVISKVIVTSENPPNHINSKVSGRIDSILVKPNQVVSKNQPLAVIQSTAEYSDVLFMLDYLKTFEPNLNDFDSLKTKIPSNLKLGSAQTNYNNFRLEYQSFLNQMVLEPEKNLSQSIELQIASMRNKYRNNQKRYNYYKEEIANSQKMFDKNKSLYDKGIISEADFLNAKNDFFEKKRTLESLKSNISSDLNEIHILRNNLKQSSIGNQSQNLFTNQSLEQSKRNLENALIQWQENYLLVSEIDGAITFFDFWAKNQNIKKEERIFTIIPQDYKAIIGKLKIPIKNSGKVREGQKVIIKLDNYPYRQWGALYGVVKNISSVPNISTDEYSAFVSIKNLNTSFNKELLFQQEMKGSAEIITEELTLIERLVFPIREVFARFN